MELSKEKIMRSLRTVIDPEVNLNIVDMGLIYGVELDGSTVNINMTLTTQGCPMKDYMRNSVDAALGSMDGVGNINIEFVWDPPWSPDKIDYEAIERLNNGEE